MVTGILAVDALENRSGQHTVIVELKNARFCKYIVDVTRLPFHSAQQRRRDRQDEAATVA
jgi:hypothetical protein